MAESPKQKKQQPKPAPAPPPSFWQSVINGIGSLFD